MAGVWSQLTATSLEGVGALQGSPLYHRDIMINGLPVEVVQTSTASSNIIHLLCEETFRIAARAGSQSAAFTFEPARFYECLGAAPDGSSGTKRRLPLDERAAQHPDLFAVLTRRGRRQLFISDALAVGMLWRIDGARGVQALMQMLRSAGDIGGELDFSANGGAEELLSEDAAVNTRAAPLMHEVDGLLVDLMDDAYEGDHSRPRSCGSPTTSEGSCSSQEFEVRHHRHIVSQILIMPQNYTESELSK
jgi:hypothetical protein